MGNENIIVISEAMDGSFVDWHQSVAGSLVKTMYHFGANDDRCKLEYNYAENQINAIFLEAVGMASIAPWTVACNEVVRAFFASH